MTLSVLLLTALLWWPVSHLITVLSVRRLERRLGRTVNAKEVRGQRNRALVLAAMLCFAFAWIYTGILWMRLYGT